MHVFRIFAVQCFSLSTYHLSVFSEPLTRFNQPRHSLCRSLPVPKPSVGKFALRSGPALGISGFLPERAQGDLASNLLDHSMGRPSTKPSCSKPDEKNAQNKSCLHCLLFHRRVKRQQQPPAPAKKNKKHGNHGGGATSMPGSMSLLPVLEGRGLPLGVHSVQDHLRLLKAFLDLRDFVPDQHLYRSVRQ